MIEAMRDAGIALGTSAKNIQPAGVTDGGWGWDAGA